MSWEGAAGARPSRLPPGQPTQPPASTRFWQAVVGTQTSALRQNVCQAGVWVNAAAAARPARASAGPNAIALKKKGSQRWRNA